MRHPGVGGGEDIRGTEGRRGEGTEAPRGVGGLPDMIV